MHVDCVYSWQLGWWGSNMEEVGWHLLRVTVKIADISWRRTNSKGRLKSRLLWKLSAMQIRKHFITCFFPAILCLRDWTKWLIKPKTQLRLRGQRGDAPAHRRGHGCVWKSIRLGMDIHGSMDVHTDFHRYSYWDMPLTNKNLVVALKWRLEDYQSY